ncbi:unnamed protein product, partial [Ectocarpus sp. 13 AM-2016]
YRYLHLRFPGSHGKLHPPAIPPRCTTRRVIMRGSPLASVIVVSWCCSIGLRLRAYSLRANQRNQGTEERKKSSDGIESCAGSPKDRARTGVRHFTAD